MKKTGFVSFRRKLIYFGATLIAIIAVPTLYFEAQRPWDELHTLIGKSQALLGGSTPGFEREELDRMNRFSVDMANFFYDENQDSKPDNFFPTQARSQAFELLASRNGLIPEKEVLSTFMERSLAFSSYRYAELKKWDIFWREEFAKRPGLLNIFRKYKKLLVATHENAKRAQFDVANYYIIVDQGSEEDGFFKDNVAFVLESHPWWKGAHPGKAYNLEETNSRFWRESYDQESGGRPGYYHNPVYDPIRFYRPRYTSDEWGTWFTSWLAMPAGSYQEKILYNTFNIDFDAKAVEIIMLRTAAFVAAATVVLLLTLILVTNRISNRLTKPIAALIEGAEAVMGGNWSHKVPTFGKDELSKLIEAFNNMTKWIGEMVNLKETLTKFLSVELAEMAAKDGLSLGGRRVYCTILFSDFAGFSTMAQMLPAEEAVRVLNIYFARLIPIIKKWGGFPDKYIGDAIVVLFGAPVHFDNHAERAVRCSIEMQQALRRMNVERSKEGKIVFEMRVGINTGDVVVGAIGCDLKMEYTSIGENTNLAHRMESKCKIGHVLMSKSTFMETEDISFMGVTIGRTPIQEIVKGYSDPVSTYGIYTHDQVITVSKDAENPSIFYNYETRKRG